MKNGDRLFILVLIGAAVLWIAGALLYNIVHGPHRDGEPKDYTYLILGLIIVGLAIIQYSAGRVRWHIDNRRRIFTQGGPTPHSIFEESVDNYYFMTGRGFIVEDIEMPTPFHWKYGAAKTNAIWLKRGFWQDEWARYCLNQPSVYNGRGRDIPFPYRGPHGRGIPPRFSFQVTPEQVATWRRYLLDNPSLVEPFTQEDGP